MNANEPAISVVVPAHNAGSTIPRLFAALDSTSFTGSWEVVVVDDGSTDATARLAEEWGATVVRLEGQGGPAAARNAGLATSSAPLIAFTDADCEPCPRWLSEIEETLGHADLVTGPVQPVPYATVGPFDRTLSVSADSPLFETANLAVRRETAERVGGFEPFAPPADGARVGLRPRVDEGHFGEDVVFGWRARRAGARIAFAERALVHHAVFPRGPRAFIAERWRLRFFPALVREVPELRSRLPLRIFLSRRTARFDLAVLGIALWLGTGRRFALFAVLPYGARHLSSRFWHRAVARHHLALTAADAIGLAALVRGSVAARRLLL